MKYINKMKTAFLFLLVAVNLTSFSQTLPKEPKNVAIFLYEGVELLDFAGPGEVFSASGFKTYTVSVDGADLTSQGFVKITPQYSIDSAPAPDIIVFPGGSSGPSSNDPRVIGWIKKQHGNGSDFMSVCTGAFILAKAGLLDNQRVTTHFGSTKALGKSYPSTTVLEDTRWVDNGFVITTAGVSAGIDGALHFVSRLKGLDVAKNTARYMEYDKWNPENGLVDKKNEYLEELANGTGSGPKAGNTRTPYLGEFRNMVMELSGKEQYSKAAKVLDAGIKLYPNSGLLFAELANVNRKLGKPAPSSETEFIAKVRDGKVDEAIAQFEKEKKSFPGWKLFSEEQLKDAAYYLLYNKKDIEGAIKAFQLNTKEYPQSADAFDSLGEACLQGGRKQEGIDNYKKAAAMGYENAKKVLKELGVM
jgi:putative intracellular protease/amidase